MCVSIYLYGVSFTERKKERKRKGRGEWKRIEFGGELKKICVYV